jgi:very-short-patch-repair endonuclease
VTSVARTLCDLAAQLTESRLTKAIETADRLDLLNLRAVEEAIARRPRATGVKRLQAALAGYRAPADTRSALEDEFMALLREADFPLPQVNVVVAGFTVDFYWPEWRLVVELDGRAYHSSPRTFEADRVKDTVLQRAGCRVMRVTRKRLRNRRHDILADINALRRLPG